MKQTTLFLFLFLVACTPDLDMTHPVSDTMGCDSGDVVDGACVLADENNAEIFGDIPEGSIITEEVELGFLAEPSVEGDYPGVVMIHEWWGLNDNIKDMAMHLAAKGYRVLAVDLYGESTDDAARARELVTIVRENQEGATQKLREATAYLRKDSNRVGSMGWCFGGGQSLQLAISGEEMDATVIYYGTLTDDKESLSRIQWPVLGIFASEDQGIPPSAVNEFEEILNELEVENDITIYEGVNHAFANPSGSRFAPDETKDAWEKTIKFLDANLK